MDKKKEIIAAIGYYYLEKNDHDYNKCHKEIHELMIHDIYFEETDESLKVFIRLERPGLLIGHRGENIIELGDTLSEVIDNRIKIHIIEEKDLGYLYPMNWDDDRY